MTTAWRQGDASAAAAVAGPDSAATFAGAALNAKELGLHHLAVQDHGPDTVRLIWSYPGTGVNRQLLPVRYQRRRDGSPSLVLADTARLPSWLVRPIRATRGPGVLVAGAAANERRRSARLGAAARRAVESWIAASSDPVVIELAADRDEWAHAVGSRDYATVAAVTTSVDGSARRDAQVRVLVNGPVFAAMSDREAQVVMTHETVHAVTRSPVTGVPMWWAEGYAEYLAFASAPGSAAERADLRRALGKRSRELVASYVETAGIPAGLPAPADFARGKADAVYELARLVCVVLARRARRFGVAPATAFGTFEAALGGGVPVDTALKETFGSTRTDLVDDWRQEIDAVLE
ncbi:MAG: hypothetical protein ACRCYQ_15885 [Nocardioides sp.]